MKNTNSVRQNMVAMKKARNGEAGQSLVFVALSLVALLGMVGLGIDMGYMRLMQGRIQTAADAAAVAGSTELKAGDITTAAQNAAAADGFTNGSGGVTVTVNNPPQSGPNTGNTNYVEVLVAQNQPTFFMNVFGISSVPLTARAVGKGGSPNCVYGIGTSGTVLTVTNSLISTACGIVGDSNLVGSGLARLSAPYVGVAGTSSGVTVTPAAKTGIPQVADPFAYLQSAKPTPDPSCLDSNGTAHLTQTVITAATTLYPGTYCGGLKIAFAADPGDDGFGARFDVTMNPGTYIMNGGGFQMTDTWGEAVYGNGVTIYNTGTGTGACTTCYGPVSTLFAGNTTLSAPTSGTYEGILYFQDPLNTQTASFVGNFRFGDERQAYTEGSFYFPGNTVQFSWDFGSTAAYTTLVAKAVNWLYTFTFHNDYSHLRHGNPIKTTGVLSE